MLDSPAQIQDDIEDMDGTPIFPPPLQWEQMKRSLNAHAPQGK